MVDPYYQYSPSYPTRSTGDYALTVAMRYQVPQHCVVSLQSSSKTDWSQRWGKLTHESNWSTGCISNRSPGSAAKYFHLAITVPNPDENTLPVQFWSTTRPEVDMFLSRGSDPNSAVPVNFGGDPAGVIKNTKAYALSPGSYILEVVTRQPYSHLRDKALAFYVQLPSPAKQYFEVKRLGATGNVAGTLKLAEFISTKSSSQTHFPYLNWTDDGCSNSPDTQEFKLWREVAYLQFKLVDTRVVPYYEGCARHDFNYRNLARIQHRVDGRFFSWIKATKDDADDRLRTDLRTLCAQHIHETEWADDREQCYGRAQLYYRAVALLASLSSGNPDTPIGPVP